MDPYNKYDLSKAGVLEVFITKANHQLSWLDLAWIYHAGNDTARAKELRDIIEDLSNKRILESVPLATWKIADLEKAQKALRELNQESVPSDLRSDSTRIPSIEIQGGSSTVPGLSWSLKVIIWIVVVIAALIAIYAVFK